MGTCSLFHIAPVNCSRVSNLSLKVAKIIHTHTHTHTLHVQSFFYTTVKWCDKGGQKRRKSNVSSKWPPELSAQHHRGPLWTLQRWSLWKRSWKDLSGLSLPVYMEQVSFHSCTRLNQNSADFFAPHQYEDLLSSVSSFALACLDVGSGVVECLCKRGHSGSRCERCVCWLGGDMNQTHYLHTNIIIGIKMFHLALYCPRLNARHTVH